MALPKISRIHAHVNNPNRPPADLFYGEKQIEENNFWDAARATYHQILTGIKNADVQLVNMVHYICSVPELRAQIKDLTRLARDLDCINADMAKIDELLKQTYAKHEHYYGGTKNGDEHVLLWQVHQDYLNVVTLYQRLVLPSVTSVLQQISFFDQAMLYQAQLQQTNQALAAAQSMESMQVHAVEQAQNPSVVTDVPYRPIGAPSSN